MTNIEIPAPPGEGALLVLSTDMALTHQQMENIREAGEGVAKRIRAAKVSGEWPVVIACNYGLRVEWIAAPHTDETASGCACGERAEPAE